MGLARNATESARLTTPQQENLKHATGFVGLPNDENNVIVKFRDDSSRGGYSTFNAKDNTTTLTLRPDKDIKNLGKNAVHEAEHGYVDAQRGRGDESRTERFENEVSAYTTQAYYQDALQYSTSSDDPWTYTGGTSEQNIADRAELSVNEACGNQNTGSCGDP